MWDCAIERSNADLMKKGLRLPLRSASATLLAFKRGPDEEGIETSWLSPLSLHPLFKRGPDEEGIETEAPVKCLEEIRFKRGPDEEGIETRKGLRELRPYRFKRGPDEEGIETPGEPAAPRASPVVQTRT